MNWWDVNQPGSRRTKIVATLGPATSSEHQIRSLVATGVDVFRLNFSHGDRGDHEARFHVLRKIEAEICRPISIMQDLQGPKLRLGAFETGRVIIKKGGSFVLDLETDKKGNPERVAFPHSEVMAAIRVGDSLLIDDGRVRLRAVEVSPRRIITKIEVGGVLSDRKGVNLPDTAVPLSAMSGKDCKDLEFGLALGVDWVALSFVQRVEDLQEARRLIGNRAGLIAKIEKPAAVACLDRIVQEADAVMVARGDLGVEVPPEDVPRIQRLIVREARRLGRPVIVATQMLESMTDSPSATRAEASDVATAISQGADAVMLSAETATGGYAVEAVEFMSRLISSVEADEQHMSSIRDVGRGRGDRAEAIGHAAFQVAEQTAASAIVVYTDSGTSALRIARERPTAQVLSVSASVQTARRLGLVWGVRARSGVDATSVEEMVDRAVSTAKSQGLSLQGQPLVVVAGMPFGEPGSTNLLRLV